ncbi:unnamed protein product [Urochloa humidicola]
MRPTGNGVGSQQGTSSVPVDGERSFPCPPPPSDLNTDMLIQALRDAGLESTTLIVGVDFTRSNNWNGQIFFGERRSLHAIGSTPNPYELAIKIIAETIAEFSNDGSIHCFGFGDESTRDKEVFSFNNNGRPCHGYKEALECYRKLLPHVQLAGPTSFIPLIEMAKTIVVRSGMQHHVLLIIADGQDFGGKTIDAIADARNFPLSIVVVGVGDEAYDMKEAFNFNMETSAFSNTQFVNFSEIMSTDTAQTRKEAEFAFSALRNIPQQFKAAKELEILGQNVPVSLGRTPLQPPTGILCDSLDVSKSSGKKSTDEEESLMWSSSPEHKSVLPAHATTHISGSRSCGICYELTADMAFNCGHKACRNCGDRVNTCHMCRIKITTRINLLWNDTLLVPAGSISTYDRKDVCPVCLENALDMALGCGHLICSNCGPGTKLCLICSLPIDNKIKLY